ncbi:MAG: DUF1549 and DUF1553 domain-containing protein, partial [Verrucomicrobiota bacterium]|nr:DUF1549 and DUF1553 domain-containing protein [Verrucomicrobiota bacterium]
SASLLIKAIQYHDPDLQMPPKGEKLTDPQIADLTAWVKMGAPDPRKGSKAKGGSITMSGLNDAARAHWAFQPVNEPALPKPKNAKWARTAVDAFVLASLEANGMHPSPVASREALLRRATYGLTGLPPTPEEIKAFQEDKSPDAFPKVIDRLLASPHYGERWGRYWLDTARYSDTTGGERNAREEYRYAHAWTYRDYVIHAFNSDKPYDQFLLQQIAADKLPDIDKEPARLAALGFLTVGQRFRNVHDTINERIDTVTKATQALTVSCARCHDHAFDPIPTADYYSLHGIFASTIEPREKPALNVRTEDPQFLDFERKLAELEQKNREAYYSFLEKFLGEFRKKAGPYLLAARADRGKETPQQIAARNAISREHKLDQDFLRTLRIRSDHAVLGPFARFAALKPEQFAATSSEVLAQIVANADKRRRSNDLVAAAFKELTAPPASIEEVAAVYAKLFAGIEDRARAFFAASRTATGESVEGFEPALAELIQTPYTVEPASKIDSENLSLTLERSPIRNAKGAGFYFDQINTLKLTHPGAPARAMVVADSPAPKNSPIFIRGEAQSRGPVAPRQYLEIVCGKDRTPFANGSGRLELAQAIASKENPLTARVMINRIWLHHFGEAMVRTPDDLGVQSEKPSHPELLDYLAWHFMEQGWSMKKLHKAILLSRVYQLSSQTNAKFEAMDPENRLLWRANIRRLDFEAMRDSLLVISGKLDRTLGGKPVNLTDEPYSYRRSVYGYIDRGALPELMAQFDFSDPEMTNTKRTTTIVPQQALFFMNSPMCVDVARKAVARPDFTAAPDDASRVRMLYGFLFQRAPRPEEIHFAEEFIGTIERSSNQVAQSAEGKGEILLASLDDKATRREAKLAQETARKPKPAKPQNKRGGTRGAIRNEGEYVERKALGAWEQYAQALLFTNEMAYVN